MHSRLPYFGYGPVKSYSHPNSEKDITSYNTLIIYVIYITKLNLSFECMFGHFNVLISNFFLSFFLYTCSCTKQYIIYST